MFKGDIDTIARHGFAEEETKDVIIAMAKEEMGNKEAIWNAIHRIERRNREMALTITFIAIAITTVATVIWAFA